MYIYRERERERERERAFQNNNVIIMVGIMAKP